MPFLEQAAKGVDGVDLGIAAAVFGRATTTVTQHAAVALCGRSPKLVTLKSLDLELRNTHESVRVMT